MAKSFRLALDWTPNTIHTGFYVAAAKGWYEDVGLKVECISPEEDGYATTPAEKVSAGTADLALLSAERMLGYQFETNPAPLIAIATILAKDATAIVSLRNSGIDRPADLVGKTYASYQTPFEDELIRQLVVQDGGSEDFQIIYPERAGIWNALRSGAADATRIFLPWEGVEARLKGIELNAFQFGDYDMPYGYNPMLVVHADYLQQESKTLKAFLQATARGYQFAKNDPFEAARILLETVPELSAIDPAFVEQSQVFIAQYYMDEQGKWGVMQIKTWKTFVRWLEESGVLSTQNDALIEAVDIYALFTNDLLPN